MQIVPRGSFRVLRVECRVLSALLLLLTLAFGLQPSALSADCVAPSLQWTNNVQGDATKIPFKWFDPEGCEYFLEGSQEETLTADSFWFILQPTFTGRDIRTNSEFAGVVDVPRPHKIVMLDMTNHSMDPNPPWAPKAHHVRLRLWEQPAAAAGTRGAKALTAKDKPRVLLLPKQYEALKF